MFSWFCRLISVILLALLFLMALFLPTAPTMVKEALYYLALALFVLSFLWPVPAVTVSHP